jgi:hypothetical protein
MGPTTRRLSLIVLFAIAQAGRAHAEAGSREKEMALALEAGPPSVTEKAGVWVHGPSGYVEARPSQNGFVCIVDHRVPKASEPQCMDAEGVRTFFPKYQLVASLRAKGSPEAEIRKAVAAGFASGTIKAPSRPGVIYMLSPHNVVTIDEQKGLAAPFPPHLMFYAPNLTSGDLGSDGTPRSPLFVVDEKTPHALMIVAVPPGGAPHHAEHTP